MPLFLCPSDPTASISPALRARNSYAGNSGTGLLNAGYNGLFQLACPNCMSWTGGPVRIRDVTDGMSNTGMVSEFLIGNKSGELSRVVWNLESWHPRMDEFKSACIGETPRFNGGGYPYGNVWWHGYSWLRGDPGVTLYNHVFVPMQPSCFNGTRVPEGIYTAASNHSGGVNMLVADGSVRFVSKSADEAVWNAEGSRAGNESRSINE